MRIVRESLFESEMNNSPKVLYHGSKFKIDLDSLQIGRDGLDLKNSDGSKRGSGSSEGGYGFYITKFIWNSSHNERVFQPLYKEGLIGGGTGEKMGEAAEKYAAWGWKWGDTAYIYRIELEKDFLFDTAHDAYISKEKMDALLNKGFDGVWSNAEGAILNRDKIKSINPIYYAKDFLIEIGLCDDDAKIIYNKSKIAPPSLLKPILKKTLGDTYYLHNKNEERGEYVYWSGKPYEDNENTKIVRIKKTKETGIYPFNWKKA